MKIQTKTPLLTFHGKPFVMGDVNLTVGVVISEVLSVSADPNYGKMRMFNLAKKFYDEDVVEVDDAELALICKLLEQSTVFHTVVLGNVLALIEESKKS